MNGPHPGLCVDRSVCVGRSGRNRLLRAKVMLKKTSYKYGGSSMLRSKKIATRIALTQVSRIAAMVAAALSNASCSAKGLTTHDDATYERVRQGAVTLSVSPTPGETCTH